MALGQREVPVASAERASALSPLSAFARLSLAAEIVGAYVTARRALRRGPLASAVAQLRRRKGDALREVDAPRLAEARRLGRAVARTLALLPGDTRCLVRSLVLTRLLARRAIPATLVIGARPAPDFLAHAWVECAGEAVLAAGEGSFARLVEL